MTNEAEAARAKEREKLAKVVEALERILDIANLELDQGDYYSGLDWIQDEAAAALAAARGEAKP